MNEEYCFNCHRPFFAKDERAELLEKCSKLFEQNEKLRAELETTKCCGNCNWNTRSVIHGKCDPNIWRPYSGTDRGRGLCNNWEKRKGGEGW